MGVLIGLVVFQAATVGSSGLSDQSFLNFKKFTQLSYPAALTSLSTASLPSILRMKLLQVVLWRKAAHELTSLQALPTEMRGPGEDIHKGEVRALQT